MDEYELTPEEREASKPRKLPLWKTLFNEMKEADEISFGKKWPLAFFENGFKVKKGESSQFAYDMMDFRQAVELHYGYYIRSTDNGQFYEVLEAEQHEDICKSFDGRMRRLAVRSINVRSAILMDPKAILSPEKRAEMEASLERAQRRLVLMARQQTITKYLNANAPELMS